MSELDPGRPSTAAAVFGDVQFWIPVVVLAGGLVLLYMLK